MTVPAARFSHTLRGVRPRARMSSEKDVSMAKFLSTRAETKLPGTLPPHQQAVGNQAIERLAHRDARHREIRGEIAFRGQRVVGAENAAVDGLAQRSLQFLIQRQIAATVKRSHCFGE